MTDVRVVPGSVGADVAHEELEREEALLAVAPEPAWVIDAMSLVADVHRHADGPEASPAP